MIMEPIQFRLSDQQRVLYQALAELNQALANMYLGALKVLTDTSNPDRLAQAAHSLRELMDKLPHYLNLPVKALNERLGEKVRDLENVWQQMIRKSRCHTDSNWHGEIDEPLRRFLKKCQQFMEWYGQHHPRRTEETKRVLRALDRKPLNLPTPLENLRVKEWHTIRDYFVKVLHHSRQPDIDEFLQRLEALEHFLLDMLRPRTFDDFAEIDLVIMEGRTDA